MNDQKRDYLMGESGVTVGRDAENDVVIPSGFMSRRHCVIRKEGGVWFLIDLDSKMGTQVNGVRVGRTMLRDGDKISFAKKYEAVFLEHAEVTATETLRVVHAPVNDVEFRLRAVDGPLQGRDFPLFREVMTIGRAETNAVRLDLDTISHHHAEIIRTEEGYVLMDLGSANGTFVNDVAVNRKVLRAGDLIRFDWVRFRFESPKARNDGTGTLLSGSLPVIKAPEETGNATEFLGASPEVRRPAARSPEVPSPEVTGHSLSRQGPRDHVDKTLFKSDLPLPPNKKQSDALWLWISICGLLLFAAGGAFFLWYFLSLS